MKYYAFKPGVLRYFGLPPKILLIMKLIVVILTTFLMQVSAAGLAQKITYTQKNASLEQVFDEITKQTGYNVLWPGTKLNTAQKVQANFKNANLEDVLNKVLANLPMSFTIDTKTIVISEKATSFLDRVVATLAGIDVSGRIVDADGRGLPGACVSVKGRGGKAVSTGANGSFYLKSVDEDAVLVVSFIGYVSKEVKAAKELGDIVLELSTSKLDEVQVIAYGTTTQRLSTGNVTTIKADVIEKQPVNNPLLALQGRVPGLFIEQATGFAGTGVKVRIQGQNSLKNGNDPLYVIDGIPYLSQLLPGANYVLGSSGALDPNSTAIPGNPLSFINPSDIESIDILKDADATAIYGSRAANGAILITTKKGKVGDLNISLNFQSGWGKVPKKLDLMNNEQYLEMRREALRNSGIVNPAPGPYGDSDLNGNYDVNRNTDWQKELIGGTAAYNDINTSISGGNDRTTFLIGGAYHRETDVFPGNFANTKASLHFSVNSATNNQRFKIQLSGTYLNGTNNSPSLDLTSAAMTLVPVAPSLYNQDGSVNWGANPSGGSSFLRNPIGQLFNTYEDKTNSLISNAILDFEILPGLNIRSAFGVTRLGSNYVKKDRLEAWSPEDLPYFTRNTSFINNSVNSWSAEPQLTFNKQLGNGKLDALLGTTFQQSRSNNKGILALNFSNDLVMDNILSAQQLLPLSSISYNYKYNAAFGRINYKWKDKYIINLSGRRDGSSRFGSENKLHSFWSAGAAWVFTEEKFINDNFAFISFGKLRGSYGTTGSDQILDYQYLSLYEPVQRQVPYQSIVNYQPNRLTNPYLQWEETRKMQLGLDLGFLNDRVLFHANYYKNRSSNQLSTYNLPVTTGFESIIQNKNSTIQNSGWEMGLSAQILRSSKLKWNIEGNLTIPKTVLKAYPNLQESADQYNYVIGESLNFSKVYHYLGVDPATGTYLFSDKDGNPTLSPMFGVDNTLIINKDPKFYGGIQNSLSYEGFQLDFLFSFVKQVAQNNDFGTSFPVPGSFNGGVSNQLSSLLKRWQKPGDASGIQRFSTGFDLYQSLANVYSSDAGISDASYIRLKNVSLSWNLPRRWLKEIHSKNCSVFVQGQNLLTLTNYTGLDPETRNSTTLPPLRVVVVGLKISL